MACPNCGEDWYTSYSNGTTRVGYCQHCSFELCVPTKEKTPMPMIYIEKPQSKQSSQQKMRRMK